MKKLFAAAALAAALVAPALVRADEPAPNSGALSLSGGVDYVTEYFFRGYKSAPAGFIVQPYGQLNVAAFKNNDFSITPYIGTWNDVQDTKLPVNADGTGKPNGNWFESDIYGGITWGLPANFKLDTIYTLYTSPANEFKTIGELGAKLAYDDSAFMKDHNVPFTIQPYVAYYWETFNDNNMDTRQYAEAGFTPTVPLGDTKLTATFPVAFGFSPDGYYIKDSGSNETFGYWSAGAFLSYPLPFPAKFGSWTITGGVTYVKDVSDSAQAANDGADHQWIGKASLTFAY
jgi:hypothetical protein